MIMTAVKYPKLNKVTVHEGYKLVLDYNNGEIRLFDFQKYLVHPFYKELLDPVFFKNVTIRKRRN